MLPNNKSYSRWVEMVPAESVKNKKESVICPAEFPSLTVPLCVCVCVCVCARARAGSVSVAEARATEPLVS